jgi:hypothetical protein
MADPSSLAQKAAITGGLSVDNAQLNRRISYKAMLDQPSDDIEALSPMLPRNNGYGSGAAAAGHGANGHHKGQGMEMRQAYGTPYETQQVPPQLPAPRGSRTLLHVYPQWDPSTCHFPLLLTRPLQIRPSQGTPLARRAETLPPCLAAPERLLTRAEPMTRCTTWTGRR